MTLTSSRPAAARTEWPKMALKELVSPSAYRRCYRLYFSSYNAPFFIPRLPTPKLLASSVWASPLSTPFGGWGCHFNTASSHWRHLHSSTWPLPPWECIMLSSRSSGVLPVARITRGLSSPQTAFRDGRRPMRATIHTRRYKRKNLVMRLNWWHGLHFWWLRQFDHIVTFNDPLLLLMSSGGWHRLRGYQFTWGPAAIARTQSPFELVRRIVLIGIPLTCALAINTAIRDSPLRTPISALATLGIPDFPGLDFLAEAFYTASVGIFACCSMESRSALNTLWMTYVHKFSIWLRLSEPILELCDPIYYQPMFDSPHVMTNVAEFWSKGWHSLLKRVFVIGGGKPAIWIAKKMGASRKVQRLAGLFGIFGISGVMHEYCWVGFWTLFASFDHIRILRRNVW